MTADTPGRCRAIGSAANQIAALMQLRNPAPRCHFGQFVSGHPVDLERARRRGET